MNTIKHHTRLIILAIAGLLALQFAAKAQTNTFPLNGNAVSITNPSVATLNITSNSGPDGSSALNLYSYDKINIATNSGDILMQAGDGKLILGSNQSSVDITSWQSDVNISTSCGGINLKANETFVKIAQDTGVSINSPEGDISLRTGSGDNITLNSPHVKSTTPATESDDLVRKDQLDAAIASSGSNSGSWTKSGNNLSYTSGYVGINTAQPTHPLTVNGAIRAKEVIVDNDNWADYVFADDYKLQSLDAIEQHIKATKHLPGIPSAAEVGKQGVSLGDMQTLLLSKIEELTLHQIDLNKRLNAQDEKLDQQSRELEALRQENATLKSQSR